MLVKNIVTIFKDFPKKHAMAIVFGLLMLVSISILGNFDFSNQKKDIDLSKKIELETLKQESEFEPIYTTKETTIKRNDSLFTILDRFGVKKENIITLVNSKNSNLLSNIEIGDKIRANLDENNEIKDLLYIDDFQSGVRAERSGSAYIINKFKRALEKVKVFKYVQIEDSMYVSGLKEGIPESVLMDVVYINGWDIDFTHDIRSGDSFSLIYEEILVDGEKVLDGDVLITEFNNKGKKITSIRFDLSKNKSEYFSSEGINVKKAFLRSPVKLSYISSKYNLRRKHPVLHTIRSHYGVDYAASKGSPVRATGAGTISFAQYNGGCGNEIKIKHSEDYTTRYCHLDRYSSITKVGRKVKQGQTIGYVGSTGLATGPHLHYEFHVNGKHTDPLRVKFPNATPIRSSEKIKFNQVASSLTSQLNNYKDISLREEVPSG
jgi:murein DD-endopeptidase MepM/ murein hydrolase activator NlpD